jgi:glycosyltransferase involved in cell wall biosynthesis
MLRGSLDIVSREHVTGWAQDSEHPERAVTVLVTSGGELLGRVVANRHRPDLAMAGLGSGRHSYELWLPGGGLSALARHAVHAVYEVDGTELPNSPKLIEPAAAFDAAAEASITKLLDGAETEAEIAGRIEFLASRIEHLTQHLSDLHSRRAWRQYCRSRFHSHQDDGSALPASGFGEAPPPRVLVVDSQLPDGSRDAGSVAILSHMHALRRLGFEVTFVPADLTLRDKPSLAALAAAGIKCYGLPLFASVEEVLRREAGSFDLVYLHRLPNAARYTPIVRHHCSNARLIYGVADLHHVRTHRQGIVEGRDELVAVASRMRFVEFMAAWAATAVITHSEAEAAVLRDVLPGIRVHVVPWAVAARPTPVPAPRRHGLAFIGSYGHAPNADAARWLVHDIMPLVWRHDPEIECLLVGHGLPDDLSHVTTRGVVPVGPVRDLAEVFGRVRLTVAPLAFGAGIKGKVLDSLAAGVPCVCTPIAAEGLALPPMLDACLASDPHGLAVAVKALHDDLAWNAHAAKAGLAHVTERYSEAALDLAMRQAVSTVLSS